MTPPPPQYLGKGTPPTVGTRIFRLAAQGFLLVPHSNYGSICYRLATIHFRDKQTDRQTDGLDDSNSDPLLTVTVAKKGGTIKQCHAIRRFIRVNF